MPLSTPSKINNILFIGLPITLLVIGSFLLLTQYFFGEDPLVIAPGVFTEMTKVPLDFFNWQLHTYSLEVENYLLFQNYESLPPLIQTGKTLVFGILIWILSSLALGLISSFERWYFVASMTVVIFILTLAGVNSLNIGSVSSNYALIILITGTVIPAMLIHIFASHWSLLKRAGIISALSLMTMALLISMSKVPHPALLMAENISLMAMAIAALFIIYIGHALVSAFYMLLSKLNQGIGIKITWHLVVFTAVYFIFLILVYLERNGDLSLPFSVPPLFFLFLLTALAAWPETQAKIQQIKQPYPLPIVGKSLFWIGFAISALVYWKAGFSANQPMMGFLDNWLVYTQIAFSLVFFVYLLANFIGIMNSGRPLYQVVFIPKFFAYIHMRLGALIALLSLIVYADGVLAPQLSTSSTNFSADYYYATERPLEARILYENSWGRYRINQKAKNAVAHIYHLQNQPSLTEQHLRESMEYNPSVSDLLFISSISHKKDNYFDAVYYLEKGLEIYPNNPYLKNNLALLYSKGNRGQEAFEILEELSPDNSIALANQIGIQVKHIYQIDEELQPGDNLISQINHLAYKNLKGDFVEKEMETQQFHKADLLTQAVWRNQWSNQAKNPLEEDLALLDSMLNSNPSSQEEEELRITRVIRTYQSLDINSTLKYLNGLAITFDKSAGYYHSLAAKILIGQGDFEKAARELIHAKTRGFSNFQQKHLPILYFGGQEQEAHKIAREFDLSFPVWMQFDEQENLIINEEVIYYRQLTRLNKAVKEKFWEGLEQLQSNRYKAVVAHEILWKKSHWLDKKEIHQLYNLILEQDEVTIDKDYLQELVAVLLSEKAPNTLQHPRLKKVFTPDSSRPGNPYSTASVLMALDRTTDNVKKYELLQDAADFNQDPLLWMEMIKYSRKIGLDHYGTAALQEMKSWVDEETLEKLQLQTF